MQVLEENTAAGSASLNAGVVVAVVPALFLRAAAQSELLCFRKEQLSRCFETKKGNIGCVEVEKKREMGGER